MTKIEKNLSIGRYFYYISIVILLLCGLTLLLSSCDGLIGDHFSSGERVAVRFSLYNSCGGDEIVRSLNDKDMEPKTVVIPLEDNLCMYVALKEDPADKTRSCEENLMQGSNIRVVAYKDSTAIFSSIYTVQADGSLGIDSLEVEEDGIYTFVAYGYNDGATPVPFPANDSGMVTDIVANEFVCGIVTGTVVNNTLTDIHIPMKRMYSKVKIEATSYLGSGSTQGFQDMGAVHVTPSYSTPDLTFPAGAFSQTDPEPVPLELADWNPDSPFTPSATTTECESKVLISPDFYGSQIKVEFSSLTVGGTHFPQAVDEALPTAYFFIEPNKNYTLQVKFSSIEFAISNIYWDQDKEELTFERALSDGGSMAENRHEYQGVYFKFGSLVGIAPLDNFIMGTDDVNGTDGTPIYVPDDIHARTWKKTNGATAYGLSATWNSILPISAGFGTGRDPNNRYVMEPAQNLPSNFANWVGDICQYIDNSYRLPTSYELTGAYEGDPSDGDWGHYFLYENSSSGWEVCGDWSGSVFSNDQGTGNFGNRCSTFRGAYFPASEYLDGTASFVRQISWMGSYWSGSVNYNRGAYVGFDHSRVLFGGYFDTNCYGMTVRCVKK